MKLLDTNFGQGQITKSIFTRLNIGWMLIIAAISIADDRVSREIYECYYSIDIGWCFRGSPIWYIIGNILILSASVTTGAILVVRHMLHATKLHSLFLAGFVFLTLYPAYTIHEVNTEAESCQQWLSNLVDNCRAHANEIHYGHYIISCHTIILGIAFLIAFFYIHHKRRMTSNSTG